MAGCEKTAIMNMTGGYTVRGMKGQAQSHQCATQRVCLTQLLWLFLLQRNRISHITDAS